MCVCHSVMYESTDPMDSNLSDFSVHGILQATVLEWVAMPSSRGFFLTQGSNPGVLHCRQTLYHLSHKGSLKEEYKRVTKYVSSDYPFGDHWVECSWNHCEMVLG